MEAQSPAPLQSARTYHLPFLRRLVVAVFAGGMIGVDVTFLLQRVLDRRAVESGLVQTDGLAGPVIILVILVVLWVWFESPRLIVSAGGIVYTELLYSIACQWSDLYRVEKHFHPRRLSVEYQVILSRSDLQAPAGLRWFLRFVELDGLLRLGEFDSDWQYHELGVYIRRYAPQLSFDLADERTGGW